MYVFCAARDVIALACLAAAHTALESSACGLGLTAPRPSPGTAAHATGKPAPAPPLPPPRLLLYCAALGFFGVFANQLLFLKARRARCTFVIASRAAAARSASHARGGV